MENINVFSAILLGLLGAGHCLAMCGGIISTLSVSTQTDKTTRNWQYILLYQLGRILSYTLFGGVAGWLGLQLNLSVSFPFLKLLSGVLLILMALYVSNLWRGLTYLEKGGKLIWNQISPLAKYLLPVTNRPKAFFLGSLWGWLPCGLVYTALGYALSLGDSISAATFMFAFGVGTLPATIFAGAASVSLKTFLNRAWFRNSGAVILFMMGSYILYAIFFITSVHHH
jgi:sulfite exporter TauE/SafE